jgi:hypothetical protein
MKKPTGYVIYQGPSLIDGSPIVAIALMGSSNRKTGNMVQTYILRTDMRPMAAVQSGADVAICGSCKHRPANGGACYVVVAQGPTVVFKTNEAGKYPTAAPTDVAAMVAGRMVRLGTYGDPAAVPAQVWEELTAQAAGRTGYTHQWDNPALSTEQRARITALCMASADNAAEATQARASGLRYFRIRLATEALGPREFVCPASDEGNKRKLCDTCGACNGTTKSTGASPVIIVHGTKKSKFATQRAGATA